MAAVFVLTSECQSIEAAEKPGFPFAWGVEAGSSIDLTSNDLSTLNLDAYFGYRNSWIDMLGVGAGIRVMLSNSGRSFPIYGMLRTNFRKTPSLCFMDLRAGYIVNNVNDVKSHTNLYLAPGVGFNLAHSKKFTSYVILAYEFNGMNVYKRDGVTYNIDNLNMAMVKIGICF